MDDGSDGFSNCGGRHSGAGITPPALDLVVTSHAFTGPRPGSSQTHAKFITRVCTCKLCKAQSSDTNPVMCGSEGVDFYKVIVWLKYVDGTECPDGEFCQLCFTTFKLSYKMTHCNLKNLLKDFAKPETGHATYAGLRCLTSHRSA